jgi:hypothetical protein
MPAITTIRLRRGTAAQWTSANPVLAAGEMGVETDTNSFKFGNGVLAWSSLPYAGGSEFSGSVDWNNVLNKPLVSVNGDDVDGGSATAWYTWKDLKIDNGNASTVILDGVYADGGSAVN